MDERGIRCVVVGARNWENSTSVQFHFSNTVNLLIIVVYDNLWTSVLGPRHFIPPAGSVIAPHGHISALTDVGSGASLAACSLRPSRVMAASALLRL